MDCILKNLLLICLGLDQFYGVGTDGTWTTHLISRPSGSLVFR